MTADRTEPRVALIVLNWNGLEDTLECLASIERMSYENCHVVVVDNGSEGNEAEIIKREYGGSISLIENSENLGYAAGNNVGIDYALTNFSPDYVLLLNNDTVVDPVFLAELVKLAESSPHIGLVGPKILYYHAPEIIQCTTSEVDLYRGKIRFTGDREHDRGVYEQASETDYVEGSCMLISTRVIEEIGMLDERYFCYWEDLEYCLRAREAGFIALYCPQAKIWHKGSRSAEGVSGFSLYFGTRNRFFVIREHAPALQYMLFLVYYFGFQIWASAFNHLLVHRKPGDLACFLRGVRDGLMLAGPFTSQCRQKSRQP